MSKFVLMSAKSETKRLIKESDSIADVLASSYFVEEPVIATREDENSESLEDVKILSLDELGDLLIAENDSLLKGIR